MAEEKERITKEAVGCEGYVHYFHRGDDFWVYMGDVKTLNCIVVKFWGESKIIYGFSAVWGWGP